VLALGNPGARYALTRHNVAWWVAEELVSRWRAIPAEAPGEYRSWTRVLDGTTVHVLEPFTFMNASGEALSAWRDRHVLDLERLLVVCDDVYLPVGALRLRAGGSSGGHRGLESVEAALGTRDYARLRLGVGVPESEALREHVLEEFLEEEMKTMDEAVLQAADAAECWLRDGLTAAMNRFNRRTGEEVSES
jgi:PTH1 family peptidyl-tRNA hydrolase